MKATIRPPPFTRQLGVGGREVKVYGSQLLTLIGMYSVL